MQREQPASTTGGAGAGVAARMFAVLCLGYVVSQFYRVSNAVIAPELMRDLSLSPEAMGAVTGIFFLAFAVFQVPVGVLLDRFGPRRVMSGCLLIAVAGAVLFALAPGAGLLTLGRALIGAGCAAGLMGSFIAIGRWYPPGRFAALTSALFTIGGIGQLMATTPLSVVSDAAGWRGAFLIIAGLTLGCAVLLFVFVRDAPPGHATQEAASESLTQIGRGMLDVLTNRQLWHVGAIQFVCYGSVLAVSGLWGGPYLQDVHGLDGAARGNVLLALNVAMLAGVIVYGRLETLVDTRKWTIVAGAAATAGVLGLLAALPSPALWQVTGLFVLLGATGSYFMLAHAHARGVLPDHVLGRGLTLQNVAVMGGVFVTQTVSGFVVGAFAEPGVAAPEIAYRTVFALLALFTLAGTLLYLPIRDIKPSQLARAG
ncbi:MAG: MFS transporter [Methyloligellaceae bacterium]